MRKIIGIISGIIIWLLWAAISKEMISSPLWAGIGAFVAGYIVLQLFKGITKKPEKKIHEHERFRKNKENDNSIQ